MMAGGSAARSLLTIAIAWPAVQGPSVVDNYRKCRRWDEKTEAQRLKFEFITSRLFI